MLKLRVGITAALLCILAAGVSNATPDIQGKVSKVVTLPVAAGKHAVRIYFSSHVNDRWGCLQNFGYIEANDATIYLDAKGLDRLVALATTALATDMTLAIDSPGTNPCTDANMFYLIKD